MRMLARRLVCALAAAAALSAFGPVAGVLPVESAQAASEIKIVVNKDVITSYDLSRRTAFLKLQRRPGKISQIAADELVDESLKKQEMARLGIRIPDAQVDAAYTRFASSNKMTTKQMGQILNQMGVTPGHFKEFIRVQIGWGQAMGARYRGTGGGGILSEQEMVAKMLERGGDKPSATEYFLQQVIFVVPAAKRGAILKKREQEAVSMRNRFADCKTTREFVKGLRDVTVRDLGRILEPELPPDWAPLVKGLAPGKATKTRTTDRGVEFIGVCSSREVSDDRVAQLMLSQQGVTDKDGEALSRKYVEELREKAKITRR